MRSKNNMEWRKKIEEDRKKTGVSPVNQDANIPRWLRKKIRKALVAHDVEVDGDLSAGSCWIWFQYFLAYCGDGKTSFVAADGKRFNTVPCSTFADLFDHAGTTEVNGKVCFVFEPYPEGEPEEYEQELDVVTYALSRILGCVVTWSNVSWHYPGNTYRILFEEG